jgi:glutamine amidotransferase
MIALIDYGAGNLQSVIKAFHYIGCEVKVTADPKELQRADAAVLPGVGAFGDAMNSLQKSGMVPEIYHFIEQNKPFLGICLGLQMLFESSEESEGVKGLGILPGKILRIPDGPGLKIPHIGWNSLNLKCHTGLFENLPENSYVYFVHSYYLKAEKRHQVIATTSYGVEIDAAVQRGNLFATQFHPEKSGQVGLKILENFVSMIGEGNA